MIYHYVISVVLLACTILVSMLLATCMVIHQHELTSGQLSPFRRSLRLTLLAVALGTYGVTLWYML